MKRVIATSAAILALTFGAAQALDATFTVTASGYAPSMCTTLGPLAHTLSITQLVGSGGKVREVESEISNMANVTCNDQAYVSVKSARGGLENGTGACTDSPSTTCVTYQAQATWNSMTATLITDGRPGRPATISSLSSAGSFSGPLLLNLIPRDDNFVLAHGTFTDTLTVQVGSPL